MDELKTLDDELATADLAKNGLSEESNVPRQGNGWELETPSKTAAVSESLPLFSES